MVKIIHDKMHCVFGSKVDKHKEIADNLYINGIMDEKEYNSVINKKDKIVLILRNKSINCVTINL